MIKPEEIKDKNFKVFLGMPMYGGMLTESTLHGLLELQHPNVIGIYRGLLQSILEKYVEKYPDSADTEKFNICENYNLQYYEPNHGFKKWHCENTGTLGSFHRHLVFMTYLNDVENAGTEFQNYPNIQDHSEQGLTLIWPAGWTHTHRGVISDKSEKYILTGWFSFEDAYKLGENR